MRPRHDVAADEEVDLESKLIGVRAVRAMGVEGGREPAEPFGVAGLDGLHKKPPQVSERFVPVSRCAGGVARVDLPPFKQRGEECDRCGVTNQLVVLSLGAGVERGFPFLPPSYALLDPPGDALPLPHAADASTLTTFAGCPGMVPNHARACASLASAL